ncbi:membrane-bound acid phosphatase [Trypanosoma grayi]|uniref:membrane-bound acid phosphatase n=1 Tax=Trypanosoma grayi TaxID=71804 RepID=UPI0004F47321|nr:membrane-bound acid phosphatase [Trypanosoma grayi]KEG05315.1 membrane-bound acid phosphatase [Trypanosoma grayi]
MCPAQACPAGYVYDATDGLCEHRVVEGDVMANGVAVGVAVLSVAAGFLLSIFVMQLCPVLLMRASGEEAKKRALYTSPDAAGNSHVSSLAAENSEYARRES